MYITAGFGLLFLLGIETVVLRKKHVEQKSVKRNTYYYYDTMHLQAINRWTDRRTE